MKTNKTSPPSQIPHQNGGFQNSLGFVLACVGSAVGMGNIWLFPYRLGQYGGAAFLLPYFFFIALFGLVGLSAEFAIGRRARTGTLGSYEYCWNRIGQGKIGYLLGWIPLLGSLGIAIGYSVILGWVLRALGASLTGSLFTVEPGSFFTEISSAFGNIPCHALIVVLACTLLMTGATKGIEKVNKILMPAFFGLFVVLAVRVFFLEGSREGYRFLFIPKWEYLLQADTWVMAMGQAFFSLSITGSGMIVYGSYLGKEEDIPKASVYTAAFDTLAAMLAGLAIMPAVFAFGIEPASGPPLMFITLPQVFAKMPLGNLFAVFFFISVAFAGITSLINMFEAVCESWQTRFGMPHSAMVAVCGVMAFGIGIFIEEGNKVGSWMDFITILVVPFGALLGAFSIYYILGWKEIGQELSTGRRQPLGVWFCTLGKYIYVPLAIFVFILGILYGGIG
ncbi:MAG: sodium-dependent transporter [Lachnospiraceae bacterium]|nr:sodium-dependent transporter [Lachnospiraceae bacterium]MCI9282309.1 sodium-dependent transporter [Lachnospiraceae bacterium]